MSSKTKKKISRNNSSRSKKNKKSLKKTSIKKQKSSLPTYNECKKLDKWHFFWNASKYKEKCVNKKCIWDQTLFGSVCNDPITITNNKINSRGLNNGIIISKIKNQDILSRIIEECNVADEKHATDLKKYYFKFRIDNIKDIVTNDINNNLIYCSDKDLRIIYNNALNENITASFNLNHLIMIKNNLQYDCYYKNLGYNPMFYKYASWFDVLNILNKCGIERNTRLYNEAYNNWNRFSRYSDLNKRKRRENFSKKSHKKSRKSYKTSRKSKTSRKTWKEFRFRNL